MHEFLQPGRTLGVQPLAGRAQPRQLRQRQVAHHLELGLHRVKAIDGLEVVEALALLVVVVDEQRVAWQRRRRRRLVKLLHQHLQQSHKHYLEKSVSDQEWPNYISVADIRI